MRRIVQQTAITREVWVAVENPNLLVPLPPAHWFGRGPRGGLYMATGNRTRTVVEQDPVNWHRDQGLVVDRSQGARYVRPGSKLAAEAQL